MEISFFIMIEYYFYNRNATDVDRLIKPTFDRHCSILVQKSLN